MVTAIKRRKAKLRNKSLMRKGALRRKERLKGGGRGGNEVSFVFCSETGCREQHSGRKETLTVVLVLVW